MAFFLPFAEKYLLKLIYFFFLKNSAQQSLLNFEALYSIISEILLSKVHTDEKVGIGPIPTFSL